MKKPQASDFVVDVMDTRVNVVFTPNGNPYMFGHLREMRPLRLSMGPSLGTAAAALPL